MTNHTQTHTGRIYVACLASYNAGILHGEWIEATADADELKARVQAMLDRSPEPYAEESCGNVHSKRKSPPVQQTLERPNRSHMGPEFLGASPPDPKWDPNKPK